MGGAGAPLPLSGPLLPLLLLLLAAGRVRGAAGGLADSVVWAVNAGGDAHVDVNGIHFRKDPLEGRVGRGEGTGGGGTGAEGPRGGSAARGACPCPVWLRSSAGNGREQGVQQGPPPARCGAPCGCSPPRGRAHGGDCTPRGPASCPGFSCTLVLLLPGRCVLGTARPRSAAPSTPRAVEPSSQPQLCDVAAGSSSPGTPAAIHGLSSHSGFPLTGADSGGASSSVSLWSGPKCAGGRPGSAPRPLCLCCSQPPLCALV